MSVYIFSGGYGSGKTNIALSAAFALKKRAEDVTVADLDIVNPYFRSADSRALLEEAGIALVAPNYANTNVESISLGADISALFEAPHGEVIADVGGDDAGAVALGQYSDDIKKAPFNMFLVVNPFRPFADAAAGAAGIMRDIEAVSHLKFTAIAANPNLGDETTAETIMSKKDYFRSLSELTGLPVAFLCVRRDLVPALSEPYAPILPIGIFRKPGWDIF